ncbi:MAG: 3-deoxy-manno-octulosonate cytidylyltransferase [Alphaproteobacteria bacterium]|jgi:3-deoxy-manno-octulosonate cytidylyltransferase (CMP-KDO synthetase)|nr:3-deoxy-manno-octulosonate cytidylyltransferase [Alphaproteobacteria bacterium]
MSLPRNPVVVIPARMASSRLPGKPLAEIAGAPMIVHVWRRAEAADLGPVVVACCEAEVAEAVHAAGGLAVMTDPDLPSGSDRVFAAVEAIDPDRRYDAVVNLQGDLPTVDPETVRAALAPLATAEVDIGTIAVPIAGADAAADPNVVKAVVELADGARIGRALYFTRAAAPTGPGPLLHHHGLYAFRRAALAEFVALPPAVLESRERLEQLRALAHGLRIDVAVVDSAPQGVDTPADLARVRAMMDGA